MHMQGTSFLPERNSLCSDDHVLHLSILPLLVTLHCRGSSEDLSEAKCLLILMCFRHSLNCSASKLSDLPALGTESSVHSKERII